MVNSYAKILNGKILKQPPKPHGKNIRNSMSWSRVRNNICGEMKI